MKLNLLNSCVVIVEGHAEGYSQSAAHRNEGTFNKVEARNVAHAGRYNDNCRNRGAGTCNGGCKVHRQKHEHRMQARMCRNSRGKCRKGKERSVAAAHNDGAEYDNGNHYQHHCHRAEAQGFAAFDKAVDSAHGEQALCEGLACNNKGNYVGHLHAEAIEEGLDIGKYFFCRRASVQIRSRHR